MDKKNIFSSLESGLRFKKSFVKFFVFAFILLSGVNNANATVVITSASGGTSISADKAVNASAPGYTTIGNIVITEGNKADIAGPVNSQTFTLSAPSGWEFNPGVGSFTAPLSGSGGDFTSTLMTVTANTIVFTYSTNNTNRIDVITISGIQVRATDGANVSGSGNIVFSALSNPISGITAGTTTAGALSQVVGTMTRLVVTLPGQTFTDGTTLAGSGNSGSVAAQTVGTSFNIANLRAVDQFFNVITTYIGTKTIAYSGPGTSSGGSSTYTTSVSFTLGVSTTTLATSLRKAETVAITATDGGSFGFASSSLVVNPKTITVSSPAVTTKTYDGTTVATVTGTLSGILSGDLVSLGTASFNNKNAGSGKAVSLFTLSNTDAANYTLTQPSGVTGTINTRALTITGAANSRTYDRTTTSVTVPTVTSGAIQIGDTAAFTQAYDTKNVGTSKVMTPSGVVTDGNSGNNYTYTYSTSSNGTITALALTITGATTTNKVFDGTTTASVTGGSLVGIVSPDVVTLSQSGIFADRNVGTSKAITSTSSIGGADAGNYALTQPTLTARDITTAALTITGLTGVNKVYNGLTAATASGTAAYSGLQIGDSFSVTGTPALNFSNANVGTAKTITVTGYTAPSSNYTVSQPTGLTADITTVNLTITGITADNKSYDGLTTATLSGTPAYSGLQNGETFTVTGTASASFANPIVGIAKALTVTGYTAPSSNYTVSQPTGLTANITTVNLTITGITANNKSYDGLTTATLSGTPAYSGLQNGETFSVTGTASASFASATVGTAKSVTVTGYTAPSSNYTVSQPTGLTADITTVNLTITGVTADNKSYDGLTTATLSGTPAYNGLQNGETFSVTGTASASFATATVGTSKSVTVTGYTAPSSNYTVSQPTGLTANITTVNLTITGVTADNKSYDGLTTATLSGTPAYNGLQNGETFSVTGTPSASFATATVGTAKAVTVTGYTAPSSNYTVSQPTGLTADITTANLTITGVTADNKSYDGLTTATLSGTPAYSGLQNGETFSVTGTPSASFATATVGTAKAVTVTGYTAPSSNYTVSQPTGLTADITTANLTITGVTADNKSYDGLTTATLSGTPAYSGLQNGETFSVTGTPSASFATATVGTAKAVTVTGYTAPSSNYTVSQPTGLTADITTVNLTITGVTADNKSYDGLTTATLSGTPAYSGLQNGETFSVTGTASASFATATVGTAKAVTVTGYTAPSSNYTVSQPTGLTADITTVNLTITGVTADNKSYDGLTTATLSGTPVYNGLQNGETFSVTGTPSASFATATVGTSKSVTVTGYTAPSSNYTVSQPTGLTADITTANLTITADDDTKVYGQTYTVGSGSIAFTSIGLQNGEIIGSITISSTGAVNTAVVGIYNIIPSVAVGGSFTASNYDITYVDGTLEISPAPLTITANDDTKVYGLTQSTPVTGSTNFTSVGLQNSQTIGSITLTYGSGAIAATDSVGSTSTITPSIAIGGTFTASNYTITYVDGTLEVTPASLTVTANDDTKVYGLTQSTPITGSTNFTSVGLQNTDVIDFVTLTYGSGALAATAAVGSTSTITPSAAIGGSFTASNYTITYVAGILEVTPASLTITADDDTKVYGQTYTVGSGSIAFTSIGLQNSETIGSITISSTGAVNTVAVGSYDIVPSAAIGGSFTASNYAITYFDGILEVTPASLTVTANDDTKVYGVTQSTPVTGATTFSTIGLQNTDSIDSVTLTYSSGAIAATDAVGSTSTITPSTAIGGSFTASNYDITYVDGTLEVIPASLTITADDVTKCNGTSYTLGTTAFTSVGLVLGETIGSVTLTSTGDDSGALSGNYPIVVSDAIGGTFTASNYSITYLDGTITVQTVPIAGSIGSAQSICFNTAPLTFTNEEFGDGDGTISYRWELNTNLSTPSWSIISGASLPTYSSGILTQTTQYRRITISTLNSVACESIPTPVIQITIIPLPVIGTIGGGNISLCSGTNSVTLTLTGSVGNILWHYAVTEEGRYRPIWGQTSPTLVGSNFTGNSTTYFFAQVTNECTTTIYPYSNKIAVTVSKAVAGTISGAGTVCTGSTRTLTSVSSVGTIQWQSSTDNGVLVPFSNIVGAIGTTFTTDPLTTPTYYRVVTTAGVCGSATSGSVVVNISSIAQAGVIPEGNIVICKGSSAPLTLTGNTAGTISWYKSVNATSITPVWTLVSGQNTTNLTSGLLSVTTWYKARVTNGSCMDETPMVKVTVNLTSVVRSIAGTGTICSGSSRLLTLGTGSIGTLQWYSTTTSATANDYSPIIGETAETYLASPTATTWYKVQATSGVCAPITSAAIIVTVNQPASVGTITATVPTLCTGTGTTITLDTAQGTIAWQRATVTNGIPGAFSAVSGTTVTLSTGVLTASRAYRAVITSGVCVQKATSNIEIVTVIPAAKVAAITGFNTSTTKVCVGTPKTLTLGTGYVGTIEWLSSPTLTGTYTVIPGQTATTYVYTPTVSGVQYFKVRTTSSPCSAQAITATGVAIFADTTNCTRQSSSVISDQFQVIAYPNPSSYEFTIKSNAKGNIEVQVYNMVGQLIEEREVNSNSVEVGRNYPSGVYNVIVTQGQKTKTLRVIKK